MNTYEASKKRKPISADELTDEQLAAFVAANRDPLAQAEALARQALDLLGLPERQADLHELVDLNDVQRGIVSRARSILLRLPLARGGDVNNAFRLGAAWADLRALVAPEPIRREMKQASARQEGDA
jgi:hypothetical protein